MNEDFRLNSCEIFCQKKTHTQITITIRCRNIQNMNTTNNNAYNLCNGTLISRHICVYNWDYGIICQKTFSLPVIVHKRVHFR